MDRKILDKHDEMVAKWVQQQLPSFEFGSTPYTALGLMGKGMILAGVVYQNYTKTDIHMHCAAVEGCRWLTRHFLGEGFRYPFEYLGCHRVTGLVPASNRRAALFDEHLGFKYEGTIRQILENGEDLLIYGMLKSECRWLKTGWRKYGQRVSDLRRAS